MAAAVFKRLDRQDDEIVPVSSDDSAPARNSFRGLILIGCPCHSNFVRADSINPTFAQDFGNLWANVFIDVNEKARHSVAADRRRPERLDGRPADQPSGRELLILCNNASTSLFGPGLRRVDRLA